MRAERLITRRLGRLEPYASFEPLSLRVDEAEQRNRYLADLRGERDQRVECLFWNAIEDLEAGECCTAHRLVDRKWRGSHRSSAER